MRARWIALAIAFHVLVLVAVMHIRIVRMLVQHPRVLVPVAMRLIRRDVRRVLMLVMAVVHVALEPAAWRHREGDRPDG